MEKEPCMCHRCIGCKYFKIGERKVCSRCRDGRCKCRICGQTRKKIDDKKRCNCTDKFKERKYRKRKKLDLNLIINKFNINCLNINVEKDIDPNIFSVSNLKNDITNKLYNNDTSCIKSDEISDSTDCKNNDITIESNNILLNEFKYTEEEYNVINILSLLKNDKYNI